MRTPVVYIMLILASIGYGQDKRISQLTPLPGVNGTELIPVARTGANYYMTTGQMVPFFNNSYWRNGLNAFGATGTIGTTDNNDIQFFSNNIARSRLSASGTWYFNSDISVNALTVGMGGGNVSTNTAIGANALLSNTTGQSLTALGLSALRSNTTGRDNTAVGSSALALNTTGGYNIAIGASSLGSNTSGNYNIAIGESAMTGGNGYYNIGLGYRCLNSNLSGIQNVAIGGDACLFSATGNANTALGYYAGLNLTGNHNLIVGNEAGRNTASSKDGWVFIDPYDRTSARRDTTQSWICGHAGTDSSKSQIYINGRVRISDGTQGASKIFTSDPNGFGSWVTPTFAPSSATFTINGTGMSLGTSSTVTAAAGTLTGSALASGVTSSSLTSFGVSPTFTTPVLGTPSSGTLTNCTGLPVSGTLLTAGTGLSISSNTISSLVVSASSASLTITGSGTTAVNASGTYMKNFYASSASTATTFSFSNIVDGATVMIDYLKGTASDLAITFPAGTIISASSDAAISGTVATLSSTASGRYSINILNINNTYKVFITQDVP